LCEVKTINKSDIELDRIKNGDVGTSPEHLGEGFFNKLLYDVKTASSQMLAFSGDTGIRRIAFIVVNFDEGVEWADEYWSQIEAYMANASMLGVEAVLVDQFGTRLLRRQWPRGGRA
jgi:hypothetical protein